MSITSDTDALVEKFSCPIGKEKCSGPIVRKERGKTFLVCSQVAEVKSVSPPEIEKCGDELPVLLFMSFMTSKRNQ